ncbi:signal peptide-containing protein [Theileria equi strain WA]|uniref:Signal peptide-containing protein n=1 Tax=Theileria equi strain WA TaxID=1537102 RepID=L0B0L7_THEEQ|nr:signal peptide-containing protein [Theileria equi strain WA]AFZ80684.1 signal peptide-containing protein [Theileria equi strain WA]|eukprot:XP_004830350.1 signal peptide-containing protein [Theileria equi strain WA]
MFFLASFIFLTLVTCGDIVVLDISSPVNPNKIVEIKYNGDGFKQSLYFPYLRVVIGSIVDGYQTIWEATKKGEICHRFKVNKQYGKYTLAYADISRNRQSRIVYYQFINGLWVIIDEQLYLRLYMKMQTERRFDISDPGRTDMCHIQDYCPFGAPSFIYTPFNKYHVKSVVDGNQVLWTSDENKCEYVVIHGDVHDPRFLHCFIKAPVTYDTLYFEKINGLWTSIPRDLFFSRLDQFDRETEALAQTQYQNGREIEHEENDIS